MAWELDDSSGLNPQAFDSLFEKLKKENEKYNKKLRKKAKKPEQLTKGLECTVLEVNNYQGSTSFTPRSEMMIGGTSPSYGGGHTYRTEIKVESIKGKTLVEKLEFNGWPHLEAGDTIKAYILKGTLEYEKNIMGLVTWSDTPPSHLVERDYQATEQPSKIEKLRDGKVVATYHNK